MQQDRARWDKGERIGTGWDGRGRERMGLFLMGSSFYFSVGFSIILCMYVKLYYLLVTDLSEKYLVVYSDLFKLIIHRSARIDKCGNLLEVDSRLNQINLSTNIIPCPMHSRDT